MRITMVTFKDFFNPKWKHSDSRIRRNSISKITDQSLLAKIAKNDEDEEVCNEAIRYLTNQDFIADVAKNANKFDSRYLAIQKLSVQSVIIDVAWTDENSYVRANAVARILDPKALADIAKKHDDPTVRGQAVSRLITELNDTLNEIRKDEKAGIYSGWNSSDINNRSSLATALGNIHDPIAIGALLNTIKHDRQDEVVSSAIEAISKYGDVVVDPLIKLILSKNIKYLRRSSIALSLLGQSALDPLISVFHNNDSDIKIAAAYSLSKLHYFPKNKEEKIWISTASHQWDIVFNSGNIAIEPLCASLIFLEVNKQPEKDIEEIINFLGKTNHSKVIYSLIRFINENKPGMLREFTARDRLKCLAAKALKNLKANVILTFKPYCFLCFEYMNLISIPIMVQQFGVIECKGCKEKYNYSIEEHDNNIYTTIERHLIPINNTKAISNFYSPFSASLKQIK